ncbi:MAG: leucine-rich repeat domain-containing protein [Acutalibacteraceae bacterium]
MKRFMFLLLMCLMLVNILSACNTNEAEKANSDTTNSEVSQTAATEVQNYATNQNAEKTDYVSSNEIVIIDCEDIPEDSDVYIQEGSNRYFDDVRFVDIGEKACILPKIIKKGSEGNYQYAVHENGKVQILKYTGNEFHVIIPDNLSGYPVSYIGNLAFAENNPSEYVEKPNCILKSIVIPDTVVSIADEAFYGCKELETIKLSNELKCIGSLAFASCENIAALELPSELEAIGTCAFENIGIKQLVIPPTIRYIGSGAFSDCPKLKELKFEGGSIYIDGGMISNSALESIYIPANLNIQGNGGMFCSENLINVEYAETMNEDTIVYAEMYRACSKLQEIKLPNNITKIEEYAFQGCTSLKEIHIPKSVKQIDTWAFTQCYSLKNVYFESADCDGLDEAGFAGQIRFIHAPSGGKH